MAKAHQAEANQEIRGGAGGDQREIEQTVAGKKEIVRQEDDGEAKQSRLRGGPVHEKNCGDEDEVGAAAGGQAHGITQGNNELSQVAIQSLVSYKMSLEGGRFLIQDEPGGANPHAGT